MFKKILLVKFYIVRNQVKMVHPEVSCYQLDIILFIEAEVNQFCNISSLNMNHQFHLGLLACSNSKKPWKLSRPHGGLKAIVAWMKRTKEQAWAHSFGGILHSPFGGQALLIFK